jgi:adenine phosphoribosyltransferase
LFSDYQAFTKLVEDLITPFKEDDFEFVAGIDALGFILGTAMALKAGKGFIPIRKGGKIPAQTTQVRIFDYSQDEKVLEIRFDAVRPGAKVLLVDDWVETGAQIWGAVKLIESLEGEIIGIATINADRNESTEKLKAKYKFHTILTDG